MKRKNFTTYTLREKHKISGSTVQRLKMNQPLSTNTLSDLCKILECTLSEVAEYVED
jgi:DNA-binding Xre family transcriptional regulator